MQDEQIIDLYWNRDERAISVTEEKYGAYCFTVAHHILGVHEDSEECVNDTWLKAWNAIPPTWPNILKMYLAKITRGLAINRYKERMAAKRGGGEIPLVLEELAECVADSRMVEDHVIAGQLEERLDAFVRSLPEREANIFLRRYFYTEPVAEIAEKYGLTGNHVMVILSRTRSKLRDQLKKEGYL